MTTNELSVAAELRFRKGKSKAEGFASGRLTISGTKSTEIEQTIYTVEEKLELGDLGSSAGYILIENLDDTNFIEIRPGSGVQDLVKVSPGLPALFELADNVTTTTVTSSNYTATPASGTTITFSTTSPLVIGDRLEITTASRTDFYTVTIVAADSLITVVGPALSEDITAIKIVSGPYAIADTAACRIRLTSIEV